MSIQVDWRETLVTYLNSESNDEAARNLNVSKSTLSARINTLRKAGVAVPKKSVRRDLGSDLFVAQLNSLVNKHLREEK